MRIAIASRIFTPEPAAASFRLDALARAATAAGHDVTVLTTIPPHSNGDRSVVAPGKESPRVRRSPVLRDRNGYVRGYLQYLSFDLPLFFRVLFGPRHDAIVIEPPPTTWVFAGLAATLRRIPYFLYAADIWSDATANTGAPSLVTKMIRLLERRMMNSSRGVLAVNDGVAGRAIEIAPRARIHTVGNGVDTAVFSFGGAAVEMPQYAIYSGTASEWQGAEVFVQAAAMLAQQGSQLEVVFLGQGSALPELKKLAASLRAPVTFHDTVPAVKAAEWLRGARMSLASISPGAGYDFAYPTKIFASWSCGTPVIYAGPGPARDVLTSNPFLGVGVDHGVVEVAQAMREYSSTDHVVDRRKVASWAAENVSLERVAERVLRVIREGLGEI